MKYIINFFDSVKVETEGIEEIYYIRLGSYLQDKLMQQKLMRISTKEYSQIENGEGKFLFYYIQRFRVNNYLQNVPEKQIRLTYNELCQQFRLKKRTRKKNMDMIVQCLNEYAEKGILITDYDVRKDYSIVLYFKPLSEYEIRKLEEGVASNPDIGKLFDVNMIEKSEEF